MKKDNRQILGKIMSRNRFAGLMDLYEQNFRLIRRLIPDLNSLPRLSMCSADKLPDLYIEVLERCKFTTSLRMTYLFEIRGTTDEYVADPDLNIRIYHDARVVEAMSCKPRGFMELAPEYRGESKEMQCRWDSNMFLQKWLEYTLEQGYLFSLDRIVEPDTDRVAELLNSA